MKPFIYNFLTTPINNYPEGLDLIEYSSTLNLSVVKGTDQPAIAFQSLSTETMLKGQGSPSDIDRNEDVQFNNFGTQTFTRSDREVTDNDFNQSINALKSLTETTTFTLTGQEPSDADNQKLFMMLSTRTLTESRETTDSDNDSNNYA